MTGPTSGRATAEEWDYTEIQAAADGIIEQIRARHPEERSTILARAEYEFGEPAFVRWGALVWAVVVAVLTSLMVVRLDTLSDLDRGAILGIGAIACMEAAADFLWSVFLRLWGRR